MTLRIKFIKVWYLLAALLVLGLPARAQVTVSLAPVPVLQFVDGAGKPYANGTITTFAAGSNTLQATYRSSDGVGQNTNPVVLDGSGRAQIWLARLSYKVQLKDAAGHQIWIVDNVKDSALALLASNNTWLGTQTFQAATTFNDIATLNNGGSFAGTITGQPSWTQLQLFNAGFKVGLTGLQATQPTAGSFGVPSMDFRATAVGPTELRVIPNGMAATVSGSFTLMRTDTAVSAGNDEWLNFAAVNLPASCVLVATPCYRIQTVTNGTGSHQPLVFDVAGGVPSILFATDGTASFFKAVNHVGATPTVNFTGTEALASSFQIQENAGLLTFHNLVSPPVNPALALNQDVAETTHLVVGTVSVSPAAAAIINHMWTKTGALDSAFTAIAAQTCQEQAMTITGVAGGAASAVSVSPESNLGNVSLTWAGRVSGASTIAVKVCNVTSGSLTPTNVNWSAFVAN